jgi:hydroxyacylglutathione hydrolase
VIFERVKSEGIAHNSYLLGSESEAAVIDPRRDCQVYLDLAQRRGLNIKHIFETHRNEDYVVGSLQLNSVTGAAIYHGPGLDWGYGHTLRDGQEFRVGSLRLTAIHTPGHTRESVSYALADLSSGEATVMVFTGDALFVGDVGRTDFYGPEQTPALASSLYDSIFNRLLPLGDGVILCPAHGAGSVCGVNIAEREESTLGIERVQNPVLQKRKDDFVKYKVAERLEMAPYFRQMEKYNLEGPPLLKGLPVPSPLAPVEVRKEMEKGAVVIDTRGPAAFGGAHIKGSLSVWLEGLPVFAGWILDYDRPILLVLEEECSPEQAVRYLVRAGYDRIAGYAGGGVEAWYKAGYPVGRLQILAAHELKAKMDRGEQLTVLDVRAGSEWAEGHIKGATHIYVGQVPETLNQMPREEAVAVICRSGHRAGIAASVLLRGGWREVYNVLGGMEAWVAAGYPVE